MTYYLSLLLLVSLFIFFLAFSVDLVKVTLNMMIMLLLSMMMMMMMMTTMMMNVQPSA